MFVVQIRVLLYLLSAVHLSGCFFVLHKSGLREAVFLRSKNDVRVYQCISLVNVLAA